MLPVRDLLEFRDLVRILAVRDVKLRYRQTVVGVAWVVLQPLLAAGILSFVFGTVAGLTTGQSEVPYFVFSFAGLMVWNVFIQVFLKATDSLVANAQLVSKIYFPRLALPLSTVFGVLVDFAVSVGLMIAFMVAYDVRPGEAVLVAPVAVAVAVMLGLGIGLVTASLNVSFRDVRYVVPVVSQFLLYATPVAYAADVVPPSARWFLDVNPLVGVLELFRWAVLETDAPSVTHLVVSVVAAVAVMVVGALVFQRTERRFADVI